MALIGNGAQSEFQAIAFHHMLGIRELRLFDTDPEATAKLKLNLEAERLPGLEVMRLRRCARGGPRRRHRDHRDRGQAQRPHSHTRHDRAGDALECGRAAIVPGKTELHADILRLPRARIVVEFEPQARIEGEIQQLAASEGGVIEIADVLSGKPWAARTIAT